MGEHIANVYAYKLFRIARPLRASNIHYRMLPDEERPYRLCGLVRIEHSYELFDMNHTTMAEASDLSAHMQRSGWFSYSDPGFFSFKTLQDLLNDCSYSYMAYNTEPWRSWGEPPVHSHPMTHMVIGTIQLSGTVVRAEYGYRSEAFQILGLYGLPDADNKLRRAIAHRIGYPRIDPFDKIPKLRNKHVVQLP